MPNIVYLITNVNTGKCYVGCTTRTINQRLIEHFSSTKSGAKTKLHNSIRKHGNDVFNIEVLHDVDSEYEMYSLEKFEIETRNTISNGYNISVGGESGYRVYGENHWAYGRKVPDDQKHQQSLKIKGRYIGSKNPAAKYWEVTLPTGDVITIDDRKGFCDRNGLSYGAVKQATYRGKSINNYKFKEISENIRHGTI